MSVSGRVPTEIGAKIGIWIVVVIAIISVKGIIKSKSPIRISITKESPSTITIKGVTPAIIRIPCPVPAIIRIVKRGIKVIPIRVVPEIIKTKNSRLRKKKLY